MKFLAVCLTVAMAPLAMSMNIQGSKQPEGDKAFLEEIEEAKLRKVKIPLIQINCY